MKQITINGITLKKGICLKTRWGYDLIEKIGYGNCYKVPTSRGLKIWAYQAQSIHGLMELISKGAQPYSKGGGLTYMNKSEMTEELKKGNVEIIPKKQLVLEAL